MLSVKSDNISKQSVLGNNCGWMHVLSTQKRGLAWLAAHTLLCSVNTPLFLPGGCPRADKECRHCTHRLAGRGKSKHFKKNDPVCTYCTCGWRDDLLRVINAMTSTMRNGWSESTG